MQIPNSDKIINEELFNKSMKIINDGFHKINSLGAPTNDASLTERDFKNTMNIIDFCLKNETMVSKETIKTMVNELLSDYDKNAYKLRPENQEMFIRIARRVYKEDPNRMEKATEISIRFIKSEATSIKFLCNNLEIFECLDIVKHETRRMILGKIKSIIVKDEFKIRELMYMISLYPNKIRTKAFE